MLNKRATLLFIFENFPYQHPLIWTYTVIKIQIIFLPTFYFFFLFSMPFVAIFHYNCFNRALFSCNFIILLLSSLKRLKLHQKIATKFLAFMRKFLPTHLLGPTWLLNFRIFSYLHCYLDSTLIRHLRVCLYFGYHWWYYVSMIFRNNIKSTSRLDRKISSHKKYSWIWLVNLMVKIVR